MARARELGAAGGVSYHDADWAKQIVAMTGGGPDLVVDSAGGATFRSSSRSSAPGGRIVSYGATTGSPSTIEVRRLFWKQVALLGSTMGTPREFTAMVTLYGDGGLRPVVDRTVPLADIAAAYQRMESGEQMGKIVVTI